MSDNKGKPEGYVFGRPTLYQPEFCQKAIEMMSQGKSKAQLCAEFSISYQTFLDWLNPSMQNHQPDFLEAIKMGETFSQAWWEELGRSGTSGENTDVNATMYQFNMKNRFKEDWRDKQEIQQTTTIVDMTDDDIDDELSRLMGGGGKDE